MRLKRNQDITISRQGIKQSRPSVETSNQNTGDDLGKVKKSTNMRNPQVCLAVEEVCRHEEFKSNLWGDGELWDLGGGVGVPEGYER